MTDTPGSTEPPERLAAPDPAQDPPPGPASSPPSGPPLGPPPGPPLGAPPGPVPGAPPGPIPYAQQPVMWGAPAGWGWAPPPPDVKPGVIPLRPLSLGEILDGAVTTIRRHPKTMLGLSALAAAGGQVVELLAVWLNYRSLDAVAAADPDAEFSEVLGPLLSGTSAALVGVVVSWLVTTLLSGVLTVVVSRAVLGQRIDLAEAWRAARPNLLRLLGLTLLVGLVVILPLVVVLVISIGLAIAVAAEFAALLVLLLAAAPLSVWLYVRFGLAGPALMLENAGVVGAMGRSGKLVERSWWRVFGILLLVTLIAGFIGAVLVMPFSLANLLLTGFDPTVTPGLLALAVQSVGAIIALTVTAPFTAAAIVLLYVDLRIRREGLDIELAAAAGVELAARPPTRPAW